jgi:hypothetical protein
MIYLIDTVSDGRDDHGHGSAMCFFINQISNASIKTYSCISGDTISADIAITSLLEIADIITCDDVLILNFTFSEKIKFINDLVFNISCTAPVIVAAGNLSTDASNFTPVIAGNNVYTIGCLNKSQEIASFSNTGDLVTAYVTGTNQNYIKDGTIIKVSGTSVSASYFGAALHDSRTAEAAIYLLSLKNIFTKVA